MNHLRYQVALINRDELLREAAARQLATGHTSTSEPYALGRIRRVWPRLRKLSPLRPVSQ